MAFNIHKYLSSNDSLHEDRKRLEKELSLNKDSNDSKSGILTDRGCIKSQLSDVYDELSRRASRE